MAHIALTRYFSHFYSKNQLQFSVKIKCNKTNWIWSFNRYFSKQTNSKSIWHCQKRSAKIVILAFSASIKHFWMRLRKSCVIWIHRNHCQRHRPSPVCLNRAHHIVQQMVAENHSHSALAVKSLIPVSSVRILNFHFRLAKPNNPNFQ